jgi:hypothetical protein
MQPLLDDAAEPAAPGTPKPPSRETEPEPAAAAVDAVAEALKGNETMFSGKVRFKIVSLSYRNFEAHAEAIASAYRPTCAFACNRPHYMYCLTAYTQQ